MPAVDAGTRTVPAGPKTVGWRGNWTGLFPEATPPTEWSRTAKGFVGSMTRQAARPSGQAPGGDANVKDGLLRDWLVIGLFPVEDSAKDFDQAQIPGEADARPAEGERVGELAWKRWTLKKLPDYERWGTTELDWVDLAEALGYRHNRVAYAHTYLYCPRAGKANLVVDHGHGLKAWVNGKPVYADRQQAMGLGSYVGISRVKQSFSHNPSPHCEITLQQGWNRLLVKVSSYRERGSRTLKFAMRLLDAGPVPYEQKHVRWMAELPERTNASPIIVGDRFFTPAEPDELLCLDKHTGKILWRRLNSLYHAVPEAQRRDNPVLRDKVAPLVAELEKTLDPRQATELRRKIQELLEAADRAQFRLKWEGHLAGHFGIVGFTTTPVSDGGHVWAFFGQGVAACYDLEGNRKWIRRLNCEEISYSCSPALVGGKLICIFDGIHALDAATGATVWSRPGVKSIAALTPGTIRGTDVVALRDGTLYRAADGKLLWSNPRITSGDTGWAAPLILGDVLYIPWYGVTNLLVTDFSGVSGDDWKPKFTGIELDCVHRRPNGEWLDRWTAGSPLVHEGIYYNIDQYGVFYAVDLKTQKTLYRQDVGFDELHHYNAIGVGASATLGGKHIYVIDNQGVCVVLEPGRTFKQLAVNRLENLLPRPWPIGPQEVLANGAPVFDGDRMYVRGEQCLYCLGR